MARHVFCNSDVAYNWAHQHVPNGRSHNGNFSFDGPLLYSYNTCVGNIVDGAHGRVWLLTSNYYSMTTSTRHIFSALNWLWRQQYYFRVPHVTIHGTAHYENLLYLVLEYQSSLRAAMRSPHHIEEREGWRHDRFVRLSDTVFRYAEAFDMPAPSLDVNKDIDSVIAHHAKRKAWRESPRGMKALEYGRRYREWRALVVEAERAMSWTICDDTNDRKDMQSELGIMSWWVTKSGDPDDLAIIKWRFRREK